MALEKKFSDFQESECKDRDFLSPIDEDFCPTCEPTPSYKPENYFYEMENPYFHKGFCEYWIRVYDIEVMKKHDIGNFGTNTPG